MNPSSKCVSLETAKKLKDAGFPQDTERVWLMHCGERSLENVNWFEDEDGEWGCGCKVLNLDPIAAPDAAEIGELLLDTIGLKDEMLGLYCIKTSAVSWWVTYGRECNYVGIKAAHSEAEARAACWLWLKENNLI